MEILSDDESYCFVNSRLDIQGNKTSNTNKHEIKTEKPMNSTKESNKSTLHKNQTNNFVNSLKCLLKADFTIEE